MVGSRYERHTSEKRHALYANNVVADAYHDMKLHPSLLVSYSRSKTPRVIPTFYPSSAAAL